MEKYQNKYRIKSHRRPMWDYSSDALYFLTLVTQNRICHLGSVIHTENQAFTQASDFGQIVLDEWYKTFEIRKELILHSFVLMPNHLHAIVEINNNHDGDVDVETHGRGSLHLHHQPTQTTKTSGSYLPNIIPNPPVRLPRSISSFIAGFKSAVNTKIDDFIDTHQLNIPKYNRYNHFFQPNYHDHIIRNEHEYLIIKRYIENNPAKWKNDPMYI
jgi:REP element-mobilizing transposase RayT